MTTAVLTLAIGIGANAVVFSVLNTLVLRPLALPHAEQLMFLQRMPMDSPNQSYPDYRDMRDQTSAFSALAAYRMESAGLDTGKNPSTIWFYETSGTTSTSPGCSLISDDSSIARTSTVPTPRPMWS
jgi:hypothetical protein